MQENQFKCILQWKAFLLSVRCPGSVRFYSPQTPCPYVTCTDCLFVGILTNLIRWARHPCLLSCSSLPLNTFQELLECWSRTTGTRYLLVSTAETVGLCIKTSNDYSCKKNLNGGRLYTNGFILSQYGEQFKGALLYMVQLEKVFLHSSCLSFVILCNPDNPCSFLFYYLVSVSRLS